MRGTLNEEALQRRVAALERTVDLLTEQNKVFREINDARTNQIDALNAKIDIVHRLLADKDGG